jgi:hypothetical protein
MKAKKETLKEGGYKHLSYNKNTGEHTLQDIETGKKEIWFANLNHASYGLIYKNTHLEFARSVK